jgi:hypothetical protein
LGAPLLALRFAGCAGGGKPDAEEESSRSPSNRLNGGQRLRSLRGSRLRRRCFRRRCLGRCRLGRCRRGSGRARDVEGQPFPADLVGQAVQLRGVPQAAPQGAAVRQVQGHRLLLQRLPGVFTTTPCLCTEQASNLPICSFASHARDCNM